MVGKPAGTLLESWRRLFWIMNTSIILKAHGKRQKARKDDRK
jgi:hypothetical protein